MTTSMPPPPTTSLPIRIGMALALAVAAAGVVAVPTALRVAGAAAIGFPIAWALVTGLVAPPIALLGLVGRRAYLGWRAFGPDDAGLRLAVALGWLAWLGLLADRLGAVLRAKTHHHALAAVTFALAVLVLALVLALVARRILVLLRSLEVRAETSSRLVAIVWAAVPLFALVMVLRTAAPELGADARAAIVDGAALLLGGILASRTVVTPRRIAAAAGAVAFVALVGLAVLQTPQVRGSVAGATPLFTWYGSH
jgi:hypothetical protein